MVGHSESGSESEKYVFIEVMKELGWTPLHCMVEKADITSVTKLLNEGFEINAKDNFNRTPLSIAASKDNLELVELLLERGANVNEGFPLHYSCEKDHPQIVNYLIKNGALVNLEKENNYPLLIAASKGNVEITKILIEHGADIHVVDENKETALHWACDNGSIELVSLLIDAGCNLDPKDKYGLNPLSICIIRQENRPDLVKLLLMKGASTDLADYQDYTHLHNSEHPESTLELIKYGVDVNAQNIFQETALSFCRNPDCAKVLLQNKANPNICALGGWTPLHSAAAEGHLDYLQELLEYGADVNAAGAENIIPLHLAAHRGHLEIVKQLLECGSFIDVPIIDVPDVNSCVPDFVKCAKLTNGLTPLSLAVAEKHTEVCELLISYGSISSLSQEFTKKIDDWPCNQILELVLTNNLDAIAKQGSDSFGGTDLIGWTPLHHSVSKGYNDMTCFLIQKGASVNALDKYDRTPLSVAAARNDLTILKSLLDSGADINLGSGLLYAIEKDSIDCIKELVHRNCDVNIKDKKESQTPALIKAAFGSKTEIVKILLNHNANANCIDKWEETPLHHSCQYGDFESVQLLVDHGANVNAASSFKDTPLIPASLSKNPDIIKFLLRNGADHGLKNKFECTPLHNAALSNFESGALELINAGASVDVVNDDVETPLFLAASNPTILKALIEHGADVNFRAPGGWTPLHESAADGNLDCVIQLLQSNANVNSASAEYVLPIYLASIKGHASIVKELLDQGSYLDPSIVDIGIIRDDSGNCPLSERYHIVASNTPLIGAASKGHLEVVKLLHSRGASLSAVNYRGNTALHEVVLNGSEEIVSFLLSSTNIDRNVRNADLQTALDLAKVLSNGELVHILKEI